MFKPLPVGAGVAATGGLFVRDAVALAARAGFFLAGAADAMGSTLVAVEADGAAGCTLGADAVVSALVAAKANGAASCAFGTATLD
jgi:hypothetical protein